jgi:MoaA/NifB/PqqE/SkfB family radical SAM enzyme
MIKNTDELIKNGNRCAIPWLHSQLNLQNNSVSPCCKYKDLIRPVESFIKIWKGSEFKKLRQDILDNVHHEKCSSCNVPDDVFSYRDLKNKIFIKSNISTELDSGSLPKLFNISLKNTCNLSCRMCSPNSSSKLAELSKKSSYLNNFYRFDEVNNKFNINSLRGIFKETESITITGGEPLIDSDCFDLINLIKEETTSLKLIVFSTNFTKPNKNIINALKDLNCKIQLNISIDGSPSINDYIRHGCNFNDIVENIQANKNFSYGVNSTVSLLNVGYIPELLDTLNDVMIATGISFTHIMSSPVYGQLQVRNLPMAVKQKYLDKLKNLKNNSTIEGSQRLINTGLDLLDSQSNSVDWENSKEFLKEFDAVTKTSYKLLYPEFCID